ncbi:MAG: hypothetical protein V2I36_17885 [Desulfopila sp.]|nr:hypothetical protein [Desulfopila sp.]
MDKEKIAGLLETFAESPGYLWKTGWLRSMMAQEALDADGHPVPWITYPAIAFLAERLGSEMAVFEYGTGNSTFWWADRVAKLVSCEHDKEWYAAFRDKVPTHITYLLRRAKGGSKEYSEEITKYTDAFDIIVIDGRDRVECAKNSLAALRSDGVIIWDNSDRREYREGFDFLQAKKFKRLDFWGMGALATRLWCTSVFYRRENCLNI